MPVTIIWKKPERLSGSNLVANLYCECNVIIADGTVVTGPEIYVTRNRPLSQGGRIYLSAEPTSLLRNHLPPKEFSPIARLVKIKEIDCMVHGRHTGTTTSKPGTWYLYFTQILCVSRCYWKPSIFQSTAININRMELRGRKSYSRLNLNWVKRTHH